jgi:hypothetical protein
MLRIPSRMHRGEREGTAFDQGGLNRKSKSRDLLQPSKEVASYGPAHGYSGRPAWPGRLLVAAMIGECTSGAIIPTAAIS